MINLWPCEKRELSKSGFTLIELVVVIVVIGIIVAIASSSFIRARVQANEGAVQGAIKTIQSAAVSYRGANASFPASLSAMGSAYLGGGLEGGVKNGYTFQLVSGNSGESYTVTAVPNNVGFSGTRGFCGDAYNVIYIYGNPSGLTADGANCPSGGTVLTG
ncbi:MAG: hypothetical protein A3G87_10065 [Omnitrophica bacterium RIFCSPLOWO2_12_FULL_50_11]|nr:MAG: hypothetical protein A3G87_10065 [Omnitrophica bacterium RIFCSPLOWO2_12_FULL_50_11]